MNPITRESRPIIIPDIENFSGWWPVGFSEDAGKKKTINPPNRISKIPINWPISPNAINCPIPINTYW